MTRPSSAYKDLVLDLEDVAARLEQHFGLTLDARRARGTQALRKAHVGRLAEGLGRTLARGA